MSKHTPRPWKIDADYRFGEEVVKAGDLQNGTQPFGSCNCCGVWILGDTQEEREANARLIAAAPDLLEASEAVVARWDSPLWKMAEHTGVFIDRLRAAIAKAEGEQQ